MQQGGGGRFNGGVSARRAKRGRQKPNGIIYTATTSPHKSASKLKTSDEKKKRKKATSMMLGPAVEVGEDPATEWFEESFMLSSISETSLSDSEWSEWDDDPVWVEDPFLLHQNQKQARDAVQAKAGEQTSPVVEDVASPATTDEGGVVVAKKKKKTTKKKKEERSKATTKEGDGEKNENEAKNESDETTKTTGLSSTKSKSKDKKKKSSTQAGAAKKKEKKEKKDKSEDQQPQLGDSVTKEEAHRDGDTAHVGGVLSAPTPAITEETSELPVGETLQSRGSTGGPSPSQSPRSRMAAAWGQKRTSVREACDAWEMRLSLSLPQAPSGSSVSPQRSPHETLSQSDRAAALLRRPTSPQSEIRRSHASLLIYSRNQESIVSKDDSPFNVGDAKRLILPLPLNYASTAPKTPKESKTKLNKEKSEKSDKKEKERRKKEKAQRKKEKSEMKKKKSRSMDVIEELKQRQEVHKLVRVRSEEDDVYFGSSSKVVTTAGGSGKGNDRYEREDEDEYYSFLRGTAKSSQARAGGSLIYTEPATDRSHRNVSRGSNSVIIGAIDVNRSVSVRDMSKREKKGIFGLRSTHDSTPKANPKS